MKHTDDKTNTALHWAAKCGRPKDIAALLKAPGIEINARTKAGVTPLIYAASEGWDDCVQLLLAAGADRAAKTEKGRTARDATTMKMAKADAETKPRLEKVLRLLDAPQTSAPPADLLSTAATDDAKAKAKADAKATEAAAKAKAAEAKPNDAFGGAKASLFAPSIPTASAGALNLFGGGAPAPAAPFGTAATPKAGAPAAPAGLFGTAPTPKAGAPTAPAGLFGTAPTPKAGAPAAPAGLFGGAAATPKAGAPAPAGLFGTAPTQKGAPAAPAAPFGTAATPKGCNAAK